MLDRCVFCGLTIVGRTHWENIQCDDYDETGRCVTLPFCNEGCANAYIEEMNREPEEVHRG